MSNADQTHLDDAAVELLADILEMKAQGTPIFKFAPYQMARSMGFRNGDEVSLVRRAAEIVAECRG